MFLQRLRTRNFRLLEEFEVDFSPDVTILIGPNNAGKSNVVDALVFLKHAMADSLMGALGLRQGFQRVVSRHQIGSTVSLELVIQLPKYGPTHYSVSFSQDGLLQEKTGLGDYVYEARRPGGAGSAVDYQYGPGNAKSHTSVSGHVKLLYPHPAELASIIGLFNNMVHVDPFRQIALQSGIGRKGMMETSGSDLATVLHYHYNNDRERFDAYEGTVREVLPEIELIETPIVDGNTATVSLRFVGDPAKYNLWQISSGLKDVLVLLAAVHFSQRDSLVIIEEPENHLHPAAQKALCVVIKRVAEIDEKQFILTTHSETVLAQFGAEHAVFIDKSGGKANATALAKVEPYIVWERMGLDRTALLEILGRAPQVLVILEGRGDCQALDPLWGFADLKGKVVPVRAEGGGWEEIVDRAADLRAALERFRIRTTPFVLIDNDGDRDKKVAHLRARGFTDANSHVWLEKEIESYLLLPTALAAISGKPLDEVKKTIDQTSGQGKKRHEDVLDKLGIRDTPPHVVVGNALRNNAREIPAEMVAVVDKIRAMLGMPPLQV